MCNAIDTAVINRSDQAKVGLKKIFYFIIVLWSNEIKLLWCKMYKYDIAGLIYYSNAKS